VPSQDDVLMDNKRCYDNILSECGITDPLLLLLSNGPELALHSHDREFKKIMCTSEKIKLEKLCRFIRKINRSDILLANS
jgi:hypothetical protein